MISLYMFYNLVYALADTIWHFGLLLLMSAFMPPRPKG